MRLFLGILAFESIMATTLFVAAGRWDLPWFWALLGIHTAFITAAMRSVDPELRRERLRPAPGGRDRSLRPIAIPFLLAHLVVAGLDVGRFHWSGPMPAGLQPVALVGYTAGMALAVWAMVSNRFFSPVIRIQHERGHTLVTAGPYRFVRHPGYVGAIVAMLCGGIVLGSWWALVPLAPFGILVLRRTVMEDRMLREQLAGYAGYAAQVRYRLLPGLW